MCLALERQAFTTLTVRIVTVRPKTAQMSEFEILTPMRMVAF